MRNDGWPAGLAAISGLALLGYVFIGTLIVGTQVIRHEFPFYVGSGAPKPFLMLAAAFGGVTLATVLLQTAALHGHWLLRIAGTSVTLLIMTLLGIAQPIRLMSWLVPITLACMVGLLVFGLIRRRRSFAWFEFPVVAVLVIGGTLWPSMMVGGKSAQVGTDIRPTVVDFTILALTVITLPALLVAGAALAELAISSANWGLTLLRETGGQRRWAVIAVVAVLLRGLQVARTAQGEDWQPSTLAGAALLLTMGGLMVLGLRRLAPRGLVPTPAELADDWTPIRVIIGLLASLALLLLVGLAVVTLVAGTVTSRLVNLDSLGGLVSGGTGFQVAQGLIVVVAVIFAVRGARRGRMSQAIIIGSIGAVALSWLLLRIPGIREVMPTWTPHSLGVVAGVLALLLLAGYAVRGTLTSQRQFALVLVFVLGMAFDLRQILDEPLSWLLGFSGVAVALLGLVWRVLTDGAYTRFHSATFPLPSRVLFFWANALFAVLSVAMVTLGRETGTANDRTNFVDIGDLTLGRPLYLAALLVCFWAAATGGPDADDGVGVGVGGGVGVGSEVSQVDHH